MIGKGITLPRLLGILGILFLGIGYLWFGGPFPSLAREEETLDELADWKTYQDRVYGFEFRYPTWGLLDAEAPHAVDALAGASVVPDSGTPPEALFLFEVVKSGARTARVTQRRSQCWFFEAISYVVDGRKATVYEIGGCQGNESGNVAVSAIIELGNEYDLYFTGRTRTELAYKMLGTVSFIK